VDELKTAIRESLEKAADEMADNELEFRLIGEIVKTSQLHFPEVLLRAEMQADAQQINERLERDKITIEQYLEEVGKTREQLEQEIAAGADVRIRNSLVLSEVAKADEITVDDSDVDAILTERAERANVSPAAVRAFAEKNDQMVQIRDQALTRKILNHLKGLSNITERFVTAEEMAASREDEAGADQAQAPADTEEAAAEADAKPKKKRASKKAEDASAESEVSAE
jgi:trigger factor